MPDLVKFKDQLARLISIQDFYIKIYYLEKQKSDLLLQKDTELDFIDLIDKKVDKYLSEIELLKEKEKTVVNELSENRQILVRFEEKEKLIKTQKEYISITNEKLAVQDILSNNQLDLGKISERLLYCSESIEKLKEEKLEKIRANKILFGEIESQVKLLDERVEEQKLLAKSLIDKVDDAIMKRFEFISRHKEGYGIVRIMDGVCEGCNILITPMIVSEVMKFENIILCSTCSRILYIESDSI